MSMGPSNTKVQSVLYEVEHSQNGGQLAWLCWRYVTNKDEEAAEQMLNLLRDPLTPGSSGAVESLRLILDQRPSRLSSKQDEILAKLVLSTATSRDLVATKFRNSPTEFFDDLYERGNDSINCLRAIVLNESCWKSKDIQSTMKQDLFQLLLAKLMENGHDRDATALRNIALLQAADASLFSKHFCEDGFDVILTSLDYRLSEDIKSQALLSISKFLEVEPELGKQYFTDFVVGKVERQRKDDMTISFSATAALFPVAPSVTSSLFLTEGFLPSLIPLLHTSLRNPAVVTSFLKLLNAASMDEACRRAINQHCSEWLSHIVSNGTSEQTALAATVLAKLRTAVSKDPGDNGPQDTNVDDLVKMFKSSLQMSGNSVATSIEGLAYTSLKPEVKESLSKDRSTLQILFRHIKNNLSSAEIVIGGLSIVSNLTQYQPTLTEEQKKMAELKAYANTSKLPSLSPLNDEAHTTARCAAVIEAGILPLLIECTTKSRSTSTKQLASNILLSLSKNSKMRGKIAQQGAVRLLVQILNAVDTSSNNTKPNGQNAQLPSFYFPAAHALARILISTNPSHIFPSGGTPSAISAMRPLIYLLKDPEHSNLLPGPSPLASSAAEPRSLLPTFESLLALTNLCSTPDPGPSDHLVRLAFPLIEDLLLSSHTYLQRAATELVCNLMATEAGIIKYADTDNDPRAKGRVHLILALCDVEDLQTRKASGGALAMLSDFPTIIRAILEKEPVGRGVENLLGLCEDDDDEVRHRGIVCIRNLLLCEDAQLEAKALQMVKEKNGVQTITNCLKKSKNPAILETGVEALKKLVE